MKKFTKYLLLIALIPALFLTSCKDDDDNPVVVEENVAFATLKTHLVSSDLDLPDVLTGWITAAPAADKHDEFVGTYDIIDIRSAEDYGKGHIEGAINSSLTGILSAAQNTTKPILVVCYTGQTAGHATVALRLSGHADTKVLKWGMSGWNSTLSGPWNGNSGAENGVKAIGNANWTTDAVATDMSYDFPAITTNATTGEAILAERVELLLNGGFKGTPSSTILEDPSNYFVNNYWAAADVEHYGHIKGAHRISPLSLENGEMANLDPAQKICTYCWTGQTSSMITAYLNVIGYDATSLKFGTNNMIYTSLESHKFVTPAVDLPLATN